jgi:S1-C subfamily serine protease
LKLPKKSLKKLLFIILIIGISYQGCSLLEKSEANTRSTVFPYESFALIEVNLAYTLPNNASGISNTPTTITSMGSGMSIGSTSNGRTAILTAEHVCNPGLISAAILLLGGETEQTIRITDFYGNRSIARVITTDSESDLCILEMREGFIPKTSISPINPRMGDKVYTVAAPVAFFNPGMVPLLSGYFSGVSNTRNGLDYVYSIPTAQGASGAAILNSDGKIVGVIHSTLINYSHVAISATHDELMSFISEFTGLHGGRI